MDTAKVLAIHQTSVKTKAGHGASMRFRPAPPIGESGALPVTVTVSEQEGTGSNGKTIRRRREPCMAVPPNGEWNTFETGRLCSQEYLTVVTSGS